MTEMMIDTSHHIAHYDAVSTPWVSGFATLPTREATRAVARHPELAEPDVDRPIVVMLSARDEDEAAELADLVAAARSLLRTRNCVARGLLRLLLPSDRLTVSRGFVAQVQRNAAAQEAIAVEFGLLTSADVAAQARSKAANAAALASRWRKEDHVFAVDVDGSTRYPGFQFGPHGKPRPVIADVLAAFAGRLSGWELALWFTGDNDWLGGLRPVDALDGTPSDLEAVGQAARRLADELAV
jgi:hypothetical protein